MSSIESVLLYGLAALAAALMIWALLRGDPASDVDKAKLIEFCQGDTDAEAIAKSVLKNKHLQKIDCARALKRIEAVLDAKYAKAVVTEFLEKP